MLEHVRNSLAAELAAATTAVQVQVDARAAAQAAVNALQAQLPAAQAGVAQADQAVRAQQASLAVAQTVVAQRAAERDNARAVRDGAARNVAEIASDEPMDVFPNGKPNPAYHIWVAHLHAAQDALAQANVALGTAEATLAQAIQARDGAAATLGTATQVFNNAQVQLANVTAAIERAQQQVGAAERDVAAAESSVGVAQAALAAIDGRVARLTAEPLDRSDLAEAADREYEALAAARQERYQAWSRRSELRRRRALALRNQDLAMAAIWAVRDEIAASPDRSHFAQLPYLNLEGTHGLQNSSFEGSATGWVSRIPGQNLQIYQSPSAKEGDWFAEMNNGSVDIAAGPSLYQDVPVACRPGQSYVFSVWVRSANGPPYHGTVALWGLGGVNEPAGTPFVADEGWTLVSARLNVVNEGHNTLRAEIYMGTADLNLDVDGARLVEVQQGMPIDVPTDLSVVTSQLANALAAVRAAINQAEADRETAAAQLAGAAHDLYEHEREGPP